MKRTCRFTLSLSWASFAIQLKRQNCEHYLLHLTSTLVSLTNSFSAMCPILPLLCSRSRDLSSCFSVRFRHGSFTDYQSCSNCFPKCWMSLSWLRSRVSMFFLFGLGLKAQATMLHVSEETSRVPVRLWLEKIKTVSPRTISTRRNVLSLKFLQRKHASPSDLLKLFTNTKARLKRDAPSKMAQRVCTTTKIEWKDSLSVRSASHVCLKARTLTE